LQGKSRFVSETSLRRGVGGRRCLGSGGPVRVGHGSCLARAVAAEGMFQRRRRHNPGMRVSAKADYAIRAVTELAAAPPGPMKGERIAQAQEIPLKFLENILGDLRNAGLVMSRRGAEGGYWLARSADEISLADVIRAVEGPIANVRGLRSEDVHYEGSAERLREVWIAVRASLRSVLEHVTVGELARGELPDRIAQLAADPDALARH
jgi:Rrf2 family protein